MAQNFGFTRRRGDAETPFLARRAITSNGRSDVVCRSLNSAPRKIGATSSASPRLRVNHFSLSVQV